MKKDRYINLRTSDEPLKEIPLEEYPRPQLKRDSYLCLNGEWDFSIKRKDYKEKIIVPYCVESTLSNINKRVKRGTPVYYRKEFSLPSTFNKGRVFLNFDGIDCYSDITLNGNLILSHRGGYIPFQVDITNYLDTNNVLEVKVIDPLDNLYPYGKQRVKRGGMWYTPVTGIWKTVWLESTPKNYIESIKIDVTLKDVIFHIETEAKKKKLIIHSPNGEIVKEFSSNDYKMTINNPRLWSPEDPYLYYFDLYADEDKISSYFALRELKISDYKGHKVFKLNNNPNFFNGLLYQGYYPDGIYTPFSYEEYYKDIIRMKELGFNTLRKHIKIEPLYFYYLCDKLGMVVFQDMVNNSKYHYIRDTVIPTIGYKKFNDKRFKVPSINKEIFLLQVKETISLLYNCPSICLWTIFNEGWGQFNSSSVLDEIIKLDTSRFIDLSSGWFDNGNPIKSEHIYFKDHINISSDERPLILSEFGGYEYTIKDHRYNPNKIFGYKHFYSSEDLQNGLDELYYNEIVRLKEKEGLCASIYTQLSDVEDETNGLLTYDRKICKVNKERMLKISEKLKF